MTDILEHSAHGLILRLLPQQQILYLTQRTILPIISEVIPTARITIQHRRRLDILFPIRLTPLTLKCIMRIARRTGLELEKLPERIEREVALHILRRVNDAGRE